MTDKPTGRHVEKPAELDEATKERIRQEEAFRAQLRAEQAAPAPEPPKPMRSFRLEAPAKAAPGAAKSTSNSGLGGVISLIIFGGLIYYFFFMPHGISTTSGQVTYSVTSSCPVDVTYTVSGVDTQQESGVRSGWTKTVDQSSLVNQLLAQLECEGGSVTATISKAGASPKSSSSNGDYTIASVSYP